MKYASRKYIDLIHFATSRWPAWEPPVQVKLGDYGTIDGETGEFEPKGNIYDEKFKKYSKRNLLEEFPPVQAADEERLAFVSDSGKEIEFAGGPTASIPGLVDASMAGTWEFSGERGALLVMHKPRTVSLPTGLLAALVDVDKLSGQHVVTNAVSCPAYAMYLSSEKADKISIALTANVPLPSFVPVSAGVEGEATWWTNKSTTFFRSGNHRGGGRVYTPLFHLKRKSRIFKQWKRDSPPPIREGDDLWVNADTPWDLLDEDGEEDPMVDEMAGPPVQD